MTDPATFRRVARSLRTDRVLAKAVAVALKNLLKDLRRNWWRPLKRGR